MSGHKVFLWVMQWLAIAGAVIGIGLAVAVAAGHVEPLMSKPWLELASWGVFPTFLIALLVVLELTSVVRGGTWWWQPSGDISTEEMKACVHWCPKILLYSCIAGVGVLVVAFAIVGEARGKSNSAFTAHEAVRLGLGMAIFYLPSICVLASAVRMPGRFADHT